MAESTGWTLGKKLGWGFSMIVGLTVLMAVVAIFALDRVTTVKDRVIQDNAENLAQAQQVKRLVSDRDSVAKRYLLSNHARDLTAVADLRDEFLNTVGGLQERTGAEKASSLINDLRENELAYHDSLQTLLSQQEAGAPEPVVRGHLDDRVEPAYRKVIAKADEFIDWEQARLEKLRSESTETASTAAAIVAAIAVLSVLLAGGIGFALTRGVTRQIGETVQNVRSSSTELQAAAQQQASGAKEQATALNEITTTIDELVSTARQIAESAQQVSSIANSTAEAARSGDEALQDVEQSVDQIQVHVDSIVEHMLDLGQKSQRVGGIVEIIDELAEQTNILAINATIEAAGAGEAGKRFAVVGQEIRRLADRVGDSTREIGGLIDEIQSAVNKTVMATESGSKAVDAGAEQFDGLAERLERITHLVGTTSEAAREIELSTQQQTSAVEQVNTAIANVAQAAKEAEVGSAQTLQTASELANVSDTMRQLVDGEQRV